jgi:membrane protein required for colicin V production
VNTVDLVIIGIVALSAIVGLVRGFIREVLSLVSWTAALVLAYLYYEPASAWLASHVENPQLRLMLAFAGVFVASLFAFTALSYLLHKGMVKDGVKGTDRLLGGLFGVARGAVVVIGTVLLLAGLTDLPKQQNWQESQLLPRLKPALDVARDMLPKQIADKLRAA